jgi:two-component system, OmpR family, sensor histidine kinase MprB
MTLRTRVTVAAGVAVLLAVVVVSAAVYIVVRENLHDQIDDSLSLRPLTRQGFPHDISAIPPDVPLVEDLFMQVVDRDGRVVTTFDDRPLPVTADVLAVARGERNGIFFDTDVDGTSVRVYVASAGQGMAVEVGRSLTEVEQALRQLVWTLTAISVGAIGLAALVGRLVAATAVVPVHRVAEAAETVAQIIRDTVTQIEELTRLVGDLVELARGDGQEEPFTVIDLDALTRGVVEAAGRNHPSIAFRVDGAPSPIRGAPGRVSRAVSNLIDNAAKWSPPGADVEIAVRDGTVAIRDHGPGVSPTDLPHVFDRFYRAPEARTLPGSGLGLAIVKQVADSHGGTVTAAAAPGGGALFVLRFPTIRGGRITEPEVPIEFSSPS